MDAPVRGDARGHAVSAVSPLANLEQQALAALPGVSIKRARMAAPERFDALDARRGDRVVTVLWTAIDGFCIANLNDDSVLGDGPDLVVHSVEEALQILMSVLSAAND